MVSIITPSYNASEYIADTIESVLSQSYTNWEMIVVDDNSTDKTREIVESYAAKDKRIKLIKLDTKHGPALARNKAIEAAEGRYIAFLDADDMWLPEKLEKQINFMREHALAFTYASYYVIDSQGDIQGTFKTREKITYSSLLKTCSVGCLTAVYDTQKLHKKYMKNIPKGQDYTLWLDILKEIKSTKGIMEPLGYYRVLNHSVSSNKFNAAKAQWNIYRRVEKLNIFKSLYYFGHYAYYGFKKYR